MAAKTDSIADMDNLMKWLPEHVPQQKGPFERTTIVHGDFRLDNVIFHPTELRILAVLDWELSTLGNPLADLSSFCQIYHAPAHGIFTGLGNFDKGFYGIPTEFKLREHYLQLLTGNNDTEFIDGLISEPEWNFYMAFTLFKMAGIC